MAARSRPQGRQDGGHDRRMPLRHADQRCIEPAGGVVVRAGGEVVVEAEPVEERTQPGVVVGAEARVGAERVRHARQRLPDEAGQHLPVRHVVRHLAQPVHVVAERQQAARPPRQHAVCMADPGRARDLAEGADVRQAGRAVAGFEQRRFLARGGKPGGDLRGLLERPGLRDRRIGKRIGGGGGGHGSKLEMGGARVNAAGRNCAPLAAGGVEMASPRRVHRRRPDPPRPSLARLDCREP